MHCSSDIRLVIQGGTKTNLLVKSQSYRRSREAQATHGALTMLALA